MIKTLGVVVKIMIQGDGNGGDSDIFDDLHVYHQDLSTFSKRESFLIGNLKVISDVFTATSSSTN